MSELSRVVAEIEQHVAAGGWDRPPLIYALVEVAELLRTEPQLADALGIVPGTEQPGALMPIEQDPLPDGPLDEILGTIEWPGEVLGCALAHEVVVLPPGADADEPAGDLEQWAASHPDRREARMVVGVLRDGATVGMLRLRGLEGEDDELVTADDLAPNLAAALAGTLT